jgi:hypothetical protein
MTRYQTRSYRNMMEWCGLDSSGSNCLQISVSCEYGN